MKTQLCAGVNILGFGRAVKKSGNISVEKIIDLYSSCHNKHVILKTSFKLKPMNQSHNLIFWMIPSPEALKMPYQ